MVAAKAAPEVPLAEKTSPPVAVGALEKRKEHAQNTGRHWVQGQSLHGW